MMLSSLNSHSSLSPVAKMAGRAAPARVALSELEAGPDGVVTDSLAWSGARRAAPALLEVPRAVPLPGYRKSALRQLGQRRFGRPVEDARYFAQRSQFPDQHFGQLAGHPGTRGGGSRVGRPEADRPPGSQPCLRNCSGSEVPQREPSVGFGDEGPLREADRRRGGAGCELSSGLPARLSPPTSPLGQKRPALAGGAGLFDPRVWAS